MKYLWQCRYFLRFGGISHSFSLFSKFFFRTIQSFIHPFAEGPLLFPHCSSLSRVRRYLLLLFLRYGTQDHLCFMPLRDFETFEKEFP
jgi:hypothetical protein